MLLSATLEQNFDGYSRGINHGNLLRVTPDVARRAGQTPAGGPLAPTCQMQEWGGSAERRRDALNLRQPGGALKERNTFVIEGSLTLLPHTQAEHQQLEKPRCFCRACLCVCVCLWLSITLHTQPLVANFSACVWSPTVTRSENAVRAERHRVPRWRRRGRADVSASHARCVPSDERPAFTPLHQQQQL